MTPGVRAFLVGGWEDGARPGEPGDWGLHVLVVLANWVSRNH